MYELDLRKDVEKEFFKLAKKNPILLVKARNKINEIKANPCRSYKFLRNKFQGLNRVHVADHFVLIFEIKHEEKRIVVHAFKHHDEAYF